MSSFKSPPTERACNWIPSCCPPYASTCRHLGTQTTWYLDHPGQQAHSSSTWYSPGPCIPYIWAPRIPWVSYFSSGLVLLSSWEGILFRPNPGRSNFTLACLCGRDWLPHLSEAGCSLPWEHSKMHRFLLSAWGIGGKKGHSKHRIAVSGATWQKRLTAVLAGTSPIPFQVTL